MKKEEEEEEGSSSTDPNPCPICLGSIIQDSYLDRCFHKYCYKCIVRWAEVVCRRRLSSSTNPSSVKCPLCKTENLSIIHGYDGFTFQQHFINQNNDNNTFFSKAHKYRLQCYYTELGLLREAFKVERYWKLHKYLLPNNRLEIWLRRELQALIQEEDVEIIMHHILGVIDSFSRSHHLKGTPRASLLKREEFKGLVADAARPFLTARTGRFVDEVELFLASDLTVEAYDNAYKRCLDWKKPEETPENTEITVSVNDSAAPCLYLFEDDSYTEWPEDEHV